MRKLISDEGLYNVANTLDQLMNMDVPARGTIGVLYEAARKLQNGDPMTLAAIRLLQNANQVSSVCNDVVGDICGIVSGSTAAVIVTHLQRDLSTTSVLISIGATALISGITIGGKALGKSVAINDCTKVVYRVARIMNALHLYR